MDDISVGVAKAQSETAETCATCGRPLTQRGPNGECLRCLVSLTFLGDGEQPETPASRGRLTPGLLRYAHFEVETGADGFPMELGAGAMAITYRARDTVLNSLVALKVIDRKVAQNPGARTRFLREARAAANIRHANVARVTYYGEQDGECFYAMELIEGETLEARVRRDGPMPLALALDVIEQAARALAAAEACGVVHRDIKPSNVMLEPDSSGTLRVKLIDYGVAKVMGPQTQSGAEQTHAGFIGTPAFASPEQFAGAGQLPVDTRSDIYSLGITLWYLLTGRTPFVGRTIEEIRARQTSDLPLEQLKRLHVPSQVSALVKSMLATDPNHRPQSARDLLLAVHSCCDRFNPQARRRRRKAILLNVSLMLLIVAIAGGIWLYQRLRPFTPEERSIAVLPFENLSSDKENAYFAEGIQDEILTRLAKIGDLKVISRTSTQHYESAPKNLREIAKQLGVAHILEGSVQKSADTVRVNVQLIRASSDSHLWSDTFDRKLTDILLVETEVAKTIADQLRAKLTGHEQ
ncbi:MAG: protein kinase domain-containing protein, partial [Candidatus Udaeobacter sp.]